jgi:hypothetical protein
LIAGFTKQINKVLTFRTYLAKLTEYNQTIKRDGEYATGLEKIAVPLEVGRIAL